MSPERSTKLPRDDALIHYPGSGTATSNAQFLYADMRGSVVASYKADGSQVSLTPYDEYGVHGSASPGRFGYTGQLWVPEAGLYYYQAQITVTVHLIDGSLQRL